MKVLQLIALTSVFFFGSAFATGNNNDPCEHPRFQEVGCSYPGEQGPPGPQGEQGERGETGATGATGAQGERGPRGHDGKDGKDGKDGADGRDGIDGQDGKDGVDGKDGRDGKDGIDGRDGRDGKDGVVDENWIIETRNWQSKWYRYSAASEAIQIHLPQDQDSRVTFGMSRIHGTTGLGVGYAYKTDRDDNLAFTLGLGTSGGERVGKASVGFEFGGDSSKRTHKHRHRGATCTYIDGKLNMEPGDDQECVE